MKDAQTSKEAVKIFRAIEDRLSELWKKLTVGNYNEATQFAYQIGFIGDINECLKKLKMKRSITNFTYNDLEVLKENIENVLFGIFPDYSHSKIEEATDKIIQLFNKDFLLCLKEFEKKKFKTDYYFGALPPTVIKKDAVWWSDIIKILGRVNKK